MSKKTKRIYLDHASATPVDESVLNAMKKGAILYANPSSLHREGVAVKRLIDSAREVIARVLEARSNEIIFTGSGTEANNLAIAGLISNISFDPELRTDGHIKYPINKDRDRDMDKIPHIVTTNIEHPSVLEVCRYLEKIGAAEVTYVPVESNGIVDPKKIKGALRPNTILVTVHYANNEIGTIQPITEIARIIRNFRKSKIEFHGKMATPFFHVDACQAMNYLETKMPKLGVDLLTFNGAKIYGPKGVGVLFKKNSVPLSAIMHGGKQEFSLRPGTENATAILGITTALRLTEKIKSAETKRLIKLRDYFISELQHSNILKNVGMLINGDLEKRLPNNVNISVKGIDSEILVLELDARGVAVSSKSACQSDDPEESYVIKAIRQREGAPSDLPAKAPARSRLERSGALASVGALAKKGAPSEALAKDGSIRFSLGRVTTKADIDYTIIAISEILTKLKGWYN